MRAELRRAHARRRRRGMDACDDWCTMCSGSCGGGGRGRWQRVVTGDEICLPAWGGGAVRLWNGSWGGRRQAVGDDVTMGCWVCWAGVWWERRAGRRGLWRVMCWAAGGRLAAAAWRGDGGGVASKQAREWGGPAAAATAGHACDGSAPMGARAACTSRLHRDDGLTHGDGAVRRCGGVGSVGGREGGGAVLHVGLSFSMRHGAACMAASPHRTPPHAPRA
jgi:hypothetical protein